MDIGDIFDTIAFDEDEARAIELVNSADFDLSELDDDGRNVADHADEKMFSDLLALLASKGIKPTWDDQ